MAFYRKRGVFRAVQYLGEHNYEEVVSLVGSRIYRDVETGGLVIVDDNGIPMPLRECDYIMYREGEYSVWSQDAFEEMYEKVEEE